MRYTKVMFHICGLFALQALELHPQALNSQGYHKTENFAFIREGFCKKKTIAMESNVFLLSCRGRPFFKFKKCLCKYLTVRQLSLINAWMDG